MKTQNIKKGFLSGFVLVILLGLMFLPVQTNATTVTWDFGTTITEDSVIGNPIGNNPWLRLTADDGGVAGSVAFTLEFFGSGDYSEYVSEFYFNLNPEYAPNKLKFDYDEENSSEDLKKPVFQSKEDDYNIEGHNFDIKLLFATNTDKEEEMLTQGRKLSFTISGIVGLTANDFNYLDSEDGYYAAALVEGTGEEGEESAWIASVAAVPEPTSLLLLGFGLIGLAVLKRRYSK